MNVTVAATQFACSADRAANLATAERLIREAAKQGANIILIQELFETPYFCKDHCTDYFNIAAPIDENPAVLRFRELARELDVVLPASVYERAGNAFYNSVAIIDAARRCPRPAAHRPWRRSRAPRWARSRRGWCSNRMARRRRWECRGEPCRPRR